MASLPPEPGLTVDVFNIFRDGRDQTHSAYRRSINSHEEGERNAVQLLSTHVDSSTPPVPAEDATTAAPKRQPGGDVKTNLIMYSRLTGSASYVAVSPRFIHLHNLPRCRFIGLSLVYHADAVGVV